MSENDSVDEIHTEGMKQQEIASIDQLSDGKSFLLFGQFSVTPGTQSVSDQLVGLTVRFEVGTVRFGVALGFIRVCFGRETNYSSRNRVGPGQIRTG